MERANYVGKGVSDALKTQNNAKNTPKREGTGDRKRTLQQSKAIRVFDKLLCDALNQSGLGMRLVLRPTYQIDWTPDSVHRELWLAVQKAKFGTSSSTELLKLGQIEEIHKEIMLILGERFNLPYINFPSVSSEEETLKQE